MKISGPFGVRKGAWTEEEDELLKKYIEEHGVGKWHQVPSGAGLNRCRKSCRLRWLNYLRPNIKRGDFTADEVDLIIRLHKLLGNRWSLIAGRLCGRTSNDIKNYWNTHLKKSHLCQKEGRNKVNTEKVMKTKIFRPRPQTFIRSSPFSGVENLFQIEDTYPNPISKSSLEDHEESWWPDNMILDFENINTNAFTFSIDNNSIEEPIKDNWVNEEVGASRFEIGDISAEDGQVNDWGDIFTQNIGIWELLNDEKNSIIMF